MTLDESIIGARAAAPAATPVITIDSLVKSFDGRVVIDHVDLSVPAGTIVTIIGQSGGGKSTLLRCVNLLERRVRAGAPLSVRRHRRLRVAKELLATGGAA